MKRQATETEPQRESKKVKTEPHTVEDCQTRGELSKLSCDQLREYLAANNLPKAGLKAALVSRAAYRKFPPQDPVNLVKQIFSPTDPSLRIGTVLSHLVPDHLPLIICYWVYHHRVQSKGTIKRQYKFKKSVGGVGKGAGDFRSPNCVTVDSLGHFFVSEEAEGRIQIFTPDWTSLGSFLYPAGKPPPLVAGQLQSFEDILDFLPGNCYPSGMVFDFDGHLCTTFYMQDALQKLDPSGKVISKTGSRKRGNGPYKDEQLHHPRSLALDLDGNLVVCDEDHHCIKVFKTDGTWLRSFGEFGKDFGQLNTPTSVAVDLEGNAYIVDSKNNRVHVFDRTGKPQRTFGEDTLHIPVSLTVDNQGSVIVVDRNFVDGMVKIFSKEGKLLTSFAHRGTDEGEMENPLSPLLLPNGDLVIVDHGNCKLQLFEGQK